MLIAPKIVQALFAAAMDFYTWKLGRKVYGTESDAAMAAVRMMCPETNRWRLTTSPTACADSSQSVAVVHFHANIRQFIRNYPDDHGS